MPFPPAKDHRISLQAAAALTRRHRATPGAAKERAGMFPREAYDALLKQEGCRGIRIYYGRSVEGEMSLVMVGVDADGNDMTSGEIMEESYPCPPICGAASPLEA
jgi:hypothetical protein